MSLTIFLKQPYSLPAQNLKPIIIISVIIGLIMYFMEPFGLSLVQFKGKTWFLFGYGFITFLVYLLLSKLVLKFFAEQKWGVLSEILWSLAIVLCIGLGNYLYTAYFFGSKYFSFYTLFQFQAYTLFLAIFPFTFLILFKQNQLLKVNSLSAKIINDQLHFDTPKIDAKQMLQFVADNGKDSIHVEVLDLAYIESVGNYIHIYVNQENELKQKILRSSISKIEPQIEGCTDLFKCHRAFVVNLRFIEAVSGNAQGYRLKIKNSEKMVLVSRQFTKTIKSALA